jgi:MerR family transcriptional regulator/heat shock protein HspR
VFIISVAARLVDMHPSTLRKYERCGLLDPPCRQSGRLRLYSPDDIARLRQIKTLVEHDGVNLAGVELALNIAERAKLLARLAREEPDADRLRRSVLLLAEDILQKVGCEGEDASSATDRGVTDKPSTKDESYGASQAVEAE